MRESAQRYHRERRGNCAQSVAHAWDVRNANAPETVSSFAVCGGGRAPGGLCGALHAACALAGCEAAETIRREFAARASGLLTCREIRASQAMSCNDCVGLAAQLLEKHAPKNR